MSWVQDLLIRVRGDKSSLDQTLAGAKSSVSSFGSVITKLGGILAAVFSVGKLISFSKESMRLAAEAEGVKNAFMKIGDATPILDNLKRATRGVMDESDLMALAIKAQNFKIPLSELATYLEFATNRAITTGKSISELTTLIVDGLGRKSSRSFIQLGLAAKDVQAAFKENHGIFKLVNTELEKMGKVSDTAGTRMQTLAANVHNMKEAWGEFINKSPAVIAVIKWISDELVIFADKDLSLWQKLNGSPNEYKEFRKNLDEADKASRALMAKGLRPGDLGFLQTLHGKSQGTGTTVPEIKEGTKAIEDQAEALRKLKESGSYTEKGYKLDKLTGLERGPTELAGFKGITNAGLAKIEPGARSEATQIRMDLEALNEALQDNQVYVDILANSFQNLFSGTGSGFQKMINGIIQDLGRLVTQLIAKQAVLAILKLLKNFSGGGIGSIVGGAAGAVGNTVTSTTGNLASSGTIKLEGMIKGSDIYLSNYRYGSMLNRNT